MAHPAQRAGPALFKIVRSVAPTAKSPLASSSSLARSSSAAPRATELPQTGFGCFSLPPEPVQLLLNVLLRSLSPPAEEPSSQPLAPP